MLKYVRVIVVAMVVCLALVCSLAYVPRAYATSADIMMVQLQAGGAGAATQELIVLYNNSPNPADVTNYCLRNKSGNEIVCFRMAPDQVRYLPGFSYAAIASSLFVTFSGIPASSFAAIYEPLSQSSGSITGSSDTVSLIDAAGNVVDQFGWMTPLPGGLLFVRAKVDEFPPHRYVIDTSADWSIQTPLFFPDDQTVIETIVLPDLCPNIEGGQFTLPEGMAVDENGECTAIVVPPTLPLAITELLPNAPGSDTGQEFIELFNPNDMPVELSTYALQVGPQFERTFGFTDISIAPKSYYVISNADVPFTLLNTSSRVRIMAADTVISETPAYQHPKDGQAWALIADEWRYTKTATPGAPNRLDEAAQPGEPGGSTSNLKPCASNQYRHPQTNRCRLVATTTSALKPCASHQERNPATNRCRNTRQIADLAPCKEGQERNPDTNRCRTVPQVPQADYAVLGAETVEETSGWYWWLAAGLIALAALTYAAWEWRGEIRQLVGRARQAITRR